MAIVSLALVWTALVGLLLMPVRHVAAQRVPASEVPINIDNADLRLVNGNTRNEGRILIRSSPDSPWTTVCFDPNFSVAIPFQMCRRLGYPFACGQDFAGARRTDEASLANVSSQFYLASCSVDETDRTAGGCELLPVSSEDFGSESPCTHDGDMWLTCGYAGMQDFELQLAEGTFRNIPGSLLQGRCGAEHDWGAICGNYLHRLQHGRVACRELGYSDQAVSVYSLPLDELDASQRPSYTLFVDVGCVGNETSLTECEHYSLRPCESYVNLECFTEIADYNETVYLCGSKQLCGDKCDQKHPISGDDEFHYCQCDGACGLFDDCCYDYARNCSLEQPSLSRGEFTADQFGCVWVPGSQFSHTGYVVVNRCPQSWKDDGARDLCEGPVDNTDVIGSLPVFDERDVDFKNIYCAICNGRPFDQLERWDVYGSDDRYNPTEERLYPSLNQTLPTKGWVVIPPRGHAVVRECPAHLVDTCLDEFRGIQVEEACRAYYAPIKVQSSDTRYRNPHCALCNGEHVVADNSCSDELCFESCAPVPFGPCQGVCSPFDGFLTIEVLFDLSLSSPASGVSCSDGQIYDPFLEKCRVLTCAAGYHIRGNECVVAPTFSPTSNNSNNALVMRCLTESYTNGDPEADVFATAHLYSTTDPQTARFSVSVLVSSAHDAKEFEAAFGNVAQTNTNDSLQEVQLPCNISSFSVLLPFSFKGSSSCTNYTSDGGEIFPGYNETLLTVVKFQSTAAMQKYAKTNASPLCLKIQELNCTSLLTLEKSEYKILAGDTIEIVATGLILSSAEYVHFPDGTTVVCSFIKSENIEPQVRVVISFIGSLLSLVALAATFVTYCVFSELRNVAGKSTMNLVVALFSAILMFFVSGYLSQNQGACEFGAVVAHFAWLAAFMWMTILSINVAYSVTSMVPTRGRRTGISRVIVAYTSLAWGIPFVIVIVCLILQYCDCPDLPVIYAEGAICWITNTTARVVAFIVPMGSSLVLNLCLYVFTLVSLRRNRHGTKAVRNQGKMESAKEELAIYAKLCALVGVTWLFGFLTQSVTGLLAFSYIYIILNYLQGVFIFISFCLNKRVRGMWRKKMGIQTGKPVTDTSTGRKRKETNSGLTASTYQRSSEDTHTKL